MKNQNDLSQTGMWRLYLFFSSITALSIALAYTLFLSGRQGLFWDAHTYYQLGEQIAQQGLFNFHDETRTFGYPLFIAIVWSLSDHLPSTVQLLILNAQLLIFLGMCFFAFWVFRGIFQRIDLTLCFFAVLALNPLILIYAGAVLSDLLSAVSIFLALLLALQNTSSDTSTSTNAGYSKSIWRTRVTAFLSFFVAGCSVMIRPANLTIVLAVASVWFFRRLIFREGSAQLLPLMILGFFIPFVPQVISNYKAYSQFQPLVVRSLFSEQLGWGMQYLKYVSVVLPGDARGVAYLNPFLPPGVTTPIEFLFAQPYEFLLTQGIHLFALFDHDFAFPYITDLNASYRLPFAIANDIFLFAALTGIIVWIPRLRHPKSFSRLDLALLGMLTGILVYLPGYILTAVEPRFSLPVYLLLSPFFVFAVWQTQILLMHKHWKMIVLQVISLIVFLVICLSLNRWLQSQVPFLDLAADRPGASNRYTMNEIQAQFGDRIELIGYGVDQTHQVQGGDTLYFALNWWCSGASTESYDMQINVVDSKDRIWSQMVQDPQVRVPPCINRLWVQSQALDIVALHLPVTMPAGTYNIILHLYDQASAQYLEAYQTSGTSLGKRIQVTTMPIAKNKSSFTADQLYIEHRYFVDMQEMRLLGYTELPDRIEPGTELELGLYWRARSKPRGDYVVVVQLRDSLGNVAIEQSARPAEGTYPTTTWNDGEVLLDWHRISILDEVSEGEYQVVVMLRDIERAQILGETNLSKISIIR